jgi:deazaflavin-dependent oxidoreductase (nitroreductase family)
MPAMVRETRGAMWRRTLAVVGALVLAMGVCLVFLIVAMRAKSPRLLGAVRRFNRAFTNKLQRQLAGRPRAYASVIRHRGRTSGRSYETPVVPFATDDGFLIVLPYGPNTDWLKNVLASGSAILVTEGRTYTIDRPEVIPTDTAKDVFPLKEQRTHRWFGIDQCLRVRRVEAEDAAGPVADPPIGPSAEPA